jgi:hypothetical protein
MFDPISLPIRLPIGAAFPVDVIDAEPSLSQYRITIQVPFDTWDTIDVFEAFNLKNEVRGQGQITDEGDVRIELRLADDLVPDLIDRIAHLTPRDGVLELAKSGDDSPALVTESWFGLHVTQAVDLPPELQQPGNEVRSGFSTSWADAEHVRLPEPQAPVVPQHRPDPADEPWPELLDVVRGYLVANDISFVRHQGADMVSADIQGTHGAWSLWISTRESERQVLVYSIFPQPIAETYRGAVADLIGRVNVRMLAGNFEMDAAEGGFRCRTSLIVNGSSLDHELLDGVIQPNTIAMDRGVSGLQALLGGATVDEALASFPKPTG